MEQGTLYGSIVLATFIMAIIVVLWEIRNDIVKKNPKPSQEVVVNEYAQA